MKTKVLIIHGWGGSSEAHWQWYLSNDLKKRNYDVFFPDFPNKDLPKYEEWLPFLKKEFDMIQPDIVVCHSLANILWFHFVSKYDISVIKKLMLVSPVRKNCKIKELETFFPYPIPTNLKAKEIIMVGSTNDPFMDEDEIMDLQSQLNVGLKIIEDGGHINTDSGYGKLSCAFDWIEREVE
jgi:predicted alpha/beta hydrolase family esterase